MGKDGTEFRPAQAGTVDNLTLFVKILSKFQWAVPENPESA